jgi:hypothetical protein
MTENFGATYERWITSSGENFDQKLRYLEFESKQQRNQQILEALVPVMGIVIEKYAGKFLGDSSALKKLLETAAPEPPPETPPQETQQGPNEDTSNQPVDAPSVSVPEPRQDSAARNTEARGKGNRKRNSRERGRKAPRKSTSTSTSTSKGKRK